MATLKPGAETRRAQKLRSRGFDFRGTCKASDPPARMRSCRTLLRPMPQHENCPAHAIGAQFEAAACREAVNPSLSVEHRDQGPRGLARHNFLGGPKQIFLGLDGDADHLFRIEAKSLEAMSVKSAKLLQAVLQPE